MTYATRFVGPLEVHAPAKKEFMAKFERYEPLVQDHSAIICAKKCKRFYFYRIVLGFTQRDEPQYFGFGSCYHKFREVLENEYLTEKDTTKRMTETAQMEYLGTAIEAARRVWKLKKMKDPPAESKWAFMTEMRLIESCAQAFKHWQAEKKMGRIEVLATEQNFIITMPNGIRVAGKADQIIRWNGKVWGRDFKTSSKTQDMYYARTLDPNDQFTRYTYAESELQGTRFVFNENNKVEIKGFPIQGQLVEVLFNGRSTKKEQKGPSIHQHMATRSASQLAKWVEEQMFYNKILDLMRDHDVYPMEEANCSFCEFHSVCKMSGERSQMAKLESEFKIEPWDCVNRVDVDD